MIQISRYFLLRVPEEASELDVVSLGSTSEAGENFLLDHVCRFHPPLMAWQRKKQATGDYLTVGAGVEFFSSLERARRNMWSKLFFREVIGIASDVAEHRHRLLAYEHQLAFPPFMWANPPGKLSVIHESRPSLRTFAPQLREPVKCPN